MNRTLGLPLLGVLLAIAVVINGLAIYATFAGSPGEIDQSLGEAQPDSATAQVVEYTGGLTQLTGIFVYVVTAIMLAGTVALFTNNSWGLTAGLVALTVDIVLKLVNVITELLAGAPFPATGVAWVVIGIEVVLWLILGQQWQTRRRAAAQPSS